MPVVYLDQADKNPKGNIVYLDEDGNKTVTDQVVDGLSTGADYAKAVGSGVLGGVANTTAGVGTFLQAPAANTLSGVVGAAALADRGITSLANWARPGSAKVNADLQEANQLASGYAAQQRADNVRGSGATDTTLSNALAKVGKSMQDTGRAAGDAIDQYDQNYNPELVRQKQALDAAEGFVGNLKAIVQNPMAFTNTLARSLPDMGIGLGVGRAAAMARMGTAGAVANEAAGAAAARVAAAGGDAVAQDLAAKEAVKVAVDGVQKKAIQSASTAGVLSEAASSAYGAREGVHQQVMSLPQNKIDASPRYQELVDKLGDKEQARKVLANELADQAPMLTAIGTAAGSVAVNKLFGHDTTAELLAGARKTSLKDVGQNIVHEGAEEVLQGIPEDLTRYQAMVQADPTQKLDITGGIAQNFMAGAAMGAGGTGGKYFYDKATGRLRKEDAPENPQNPGQPPAGTEKNAIDSVATGGDAVDSGDVLGKVKAEEPTAAEKALQEPTSLTALDRVNEIDQQGAKLRARLDELNDPAKGYGPMFDQERQDLTTQSEALAGERDGITKDWPKAVPGAETSFTTEAGARVHAQYAIMDAGALQTSHDENLRPNPVYPKELQPRDRDRAASEVQVSGIVQKLDPARLGLSADAANGAPIVGADGLVESGNARTIALKRVYQANGQKADDYKQFLRQNAAQFGITPESVDAMDKPVLVRVRTTPVNRAEFARQANASTVAAMSPAEQARSDSNRIDSLDDLTPDDNGDFATSRDFIRRFMSRLPVTEQSGMVDANGALSATGYARVRNAVLAKAYGDSPVLMRMVESMDDNLRNVSKALMIAAPRIAKTREAVRDGNLHDADITPDLMHSVEELSRLKESGTSVQDALSQSAMFGDGYSPETRALLQFQADNLRRPRRMADFLVAYMDALEAAGNPNQGSLLGDTAPPAKQELLTAAQRTIDNGNSASQNTQRGNPGEGSQVGGQVGGQPQDAPGSGGGTQGDGLAGRNPTSTATGTEADTTLSRGTGGQQQPGGWVNFPQESGTRGIPRAQMPQIKSSDRGALVSFLKGRGISHSNEDVPASSLKPTQAEFSPSKVKYWMEQESGGQAGDRSVLVSSDGYVLDGHHQLVGSQAMGKSVKVMRFDAPIDQLLAAVREFPSVRTSDGAAPGGKTGSREQARSDFMDALADLAQIASRHTRLAMVPEDTPDLMPTLVKLFTAGMKEIGHNLNDLKNYVKNQLKVHPTFKTFWNKISNETYHKAARMALDAAERAGGQQDGMFGGAADVSTNPVQSLMFGKDAPSKSNPVVMVFGGSFNPVHEGHVEVARQARQLLIDAGYDVKTSVVVPSPQHLLVRKSGDKANGLGHRTAMAKQAFARLAKEGFVVNDESSRIADDNEGVRKPKRYDTADWAQEQYPGATVVNVTGADQAHEEAPGFPSLYKVHSESGKNKSGYFFLALPRDESEENGISSSKIRKKIESDTDVPSEWANSAVVGYFKALVGKSNQIAIDGHLLDKYALDFGRPFPITLPNDSPILAETYNKSRHEAIAASPVRYEDMGMTRSQMWNIIEDDFFRGKDPAPQGRKPIAYVMGGGGASGKGTIKAKLMRQGLIDGTNSIDIDADEIKGHIPEYGAAWKRGDSRGAATVHEESSMLAKRIRSRAIGGKYDVTLDVTLGNPAKGVEAIQDLKKAGYEVRLFGVNIEPETAVRRAIERGFSNGRFVPIKALLEAHAGFAAGWESYWPLVDQARLYDTSDGVLTVAEKVGGSLDIKHKKAYHRFGERSAINVESRTYSEVGSYRGRTAEPGGQADALARGAPSDSGTGTGTGASEGRGTVDQNAGQAGGSGVSQGNGPGGLNANSQTGRSGAQGQGAGAVQGTVSQRKTGRVRSGPVEPDLFGSGVDDAAGSNQRQVGRPGPDGVRQQNEGGGKPQSGKGSGRNAGIPAGRDIPAKSGLNYQFGPGDLTYEGSWAVKGEQNVAAVELLKALEKEGRQATPEEQKVLAKFVGWGSSELANNLFGPKLDKDARALDDYRTAVAAMDKLGRDYLQKGGQYRGQYADNGYYDAANLLREAKKIGPHDYPQRITRADLDAAKPGGSAQKWIALRDRLRAVMGPKELAEAARSTQYAHYTSKAVVQSMWKAMERMGFNGGHILEPGAGIGVFPGLMPQAMANNSSYTGIEFDSMTGGILKQLFPDERILVESFVDTKLPKNFYDVAVGNPPFSGTKILGDPEYVKQAFSLHDYFFAKSIDRVKPGGLVVYITSRYTMDKLDDKARAYLADRADLVGAIRLPQTAFKQNAGTEVVTDVIFLRKKVKGETFEHAQDWMKVSKAKAADGSDLMVSGNKEGASDQHALINEYFAAHPEMVLGQNANTGSMYRDKEYTVTPLAGDIEAHFAKAVENLPANIYQAERGSSAEASKVREIDFNPKAKKEGNYYVTDAGVLMQRESGVGVRVQENFPPKTAELLKDFVPLRDALKQAHYDQLNDGEWQKSLIALQDAYAAFTKKNGDINQSTAKTVNVKVDELDEDGNPTGKTVTDEEVRRSFPLLDKIKDDPDWTLVAALEKVNGDTGEVSRSEFLDRRVLGAKVESKVATPSDALLTTLNDLGHVDVGVIADRIGMSEADTIEALGSSVYNDPEAGWTTADDYLSGNVKHKLELARAAAKSDRRFERNVTALEAHQPEPLSPSQISPRMGMNWIPGDIYSQFMREHVGIKDISVEWDPRTKSWHFDWESPETHEVTNMWGRREKVYKSLAAAEKAAAKMNERYEKPRYQVKAIENAINKASIEDWGVPNFPAQSLMEHAITGAPVKVYAKDKDGKSRLDEAQTEAANEKLDKLHSEFQAWVFSEPNRSDRLVQMYNDKFNTTVARSFDGSHLTLPGASLHWQKQVHAHVKRGVWRIVQTGNTYLAHAVGSGKTAQMVMSAMEQKRLGLIKKPMIVVPNHMLKQFASEWLDIYPAARLMVADEHNFHTDNRRRFVSRVALSDLDGVVITHSAFKLLDLDPAFKTKMIEEQLAFFRAALEEAGGNPDGEKGKSRDPKIKRIESQIENFEQKLEAATSSAGKDKNARFDELGVDFLYVDEAHEYRKLDFTTVREVKGLSPQGSGKAFDLYMKSRYLESKTPGRSMVMASGTPVTNTMAELYSVQKMLGHQALVDKGLESFDSWASMFGREKTNLEPDASGQYENVSRFQEFVNVPEMTQMFREFADVLTSDYLAEKLGDKRPKVQGGSRTNTVTPKTAEYKEFQAELRRRMEASREWKPSKDEPNNPDPVIRIIGDGRLAAIDMRFMNPTLPSNPDSKLNRMIDDVIAAFKETASQEFENKDKTGMEPTKGATMMVFSDLGFGAGVAASRGFNARAWMEHRLRDAGIPMNQVAFMSDYKKSSAKLKLFSDVNAGRVRILVGSSKSMGTGVNAQQRLKDLFHLDSPWYPADLEQREGRIVRQGNKNKEVRIRAYAAKGTYDEQMWSQLANKQMFIDKAMSGDPNVRSIEDAGAADNMALMAGMVADDPRVLQLAGLETEINKLQRLFQAHEDTRASYRKRFQSAQSTVEWNEARLPDAEKEAGKSQDLSGDRFTARVNGKDYTERAKWAEALIAKYKDLTDRGVTQVQKVGEISGFDIAYGGETVAGQYRAKLMLATPKPMELVTDAGTSPQGVAMRAQNAVAEVGRLPGLMRERIRESRATMDSLGSRMEATFPMRELLAQKIQERNELRAILAATSQEKDEGAINDLVSLLDRLVGVGDVTETMWGDMGSVNADGNEADILLSRGTGGAMDVKALQAMANRVKAKMPNMPKVHVLASPNDLPESASGLRNYITKKGAWGDVEGAMHGGELYLFASGLRDLARAEHVLVEHEAAHYGLRGVLGSDQNRSVMQAIFNNNPVIRQAAKELQARGEPSDEKLSDAAATEEVIVDMPSSELVKLKGWRKVAVIVRDWLDDHGFKALAGQLDGWLSGALSEQEKADLFVADLVRAARGFVAGRVPGDSAAAKNATRLAQTLADDIAEQEKWLDTEARARGYKSIDELAEKDYQVFMNLAARWRELHPADVLLSRAHVALVSGQKDLDSWIVRGTKDLQRSIDKGHGNQSDVLLGRTPHVLHMVSGTVPAQGLSIPGNIVNKVFHDKHAGKMSGVTPDLLTKGIYKPAMVFQDARKPNEFVLVTGILTEFGPVQVAIKTGAELPDGSKGAIVTSIYPRGVVPTKENGLASQSISQWVRDEAGANAKLVYADKDLAQAVITGRENEKARAIGGLSVGREEINNRWQSAVKPTSSTPTSSNVSKNGTPVNENYAGWNTVAATLQARWDGARIKGQPQPRLKDYGSLLAWIGKHYGDRDPSDRPMFSRQWHGSPVYGFEKFDESNMGSGYGAQRFGWGFYFGTRKLAEHYRVGLNAGGGNGISTESIQIEGQKPDYKNPAHQAAIDVLIHGGNREAALNWYQIRGFSPERESGMKYLMSGADIPVATARKTGGLYEVEIPDDDKMLLWDNRIDEGQPQEKAILKVANKHDIAISPETTGKDFYTALSEKLGEPRLASKELDAAGIKGNKFLDPDPTLAGHGAFSYVVFNTGDTDVVTRLSRATRKTPTERADKILSERAATKAPLDFVASFVTRTLRVDRATGALYDKAAALLDRHTPEAIKAGVVSDYGVPEAVIDQRTMMQGRQRVQLRQAGTLIDKLSTLTRAESRVAYEWMNMDGSDPKAYVSMMQGLPEESVKVLTEVQKLIDKLSQEAVDLGQLSPEAFKEHRFAYLRRSYVKHTAELTKAEAASRQRSIAILGDQYKGRGMTDSAAMKQIQNIAPEWWKRKFVEGKADTSLKGEKFVRLERRAPSGERTQALDGMTGKQRGKLLEVNYYPAGEKLPAKYADWDKSGTWVVRDTKGGNAIMWRDFTKEERETMGEIDEARYAIAKTLHGMIHDVEVGRYLQWMAHTYAKKEGETIPGQVVDASTSMWATFKPGDWVRVPDAKIQGTQVAKYGLLAGRYIPGPIWNDVRQVVHGDYRPLGDTYAKVLSLWKTAKTALSPAVHTNNVMANFVMADWHDVTAGHVSKALRLVMAASQRDGKGVLGSAGNAVARLGIQDVEAAREILTRYQDSGGSIGTWATQEIARDQLAPLLDSLEKELAAAGLAAGQAQVGVMAALQHALNLRFPQALAAANGSKAAGAVKQEANNLIDLYEAEDQVFRLASWLKAKENGASDLEAGKTSRKSFLDYHINAPWIAWMRATGWPFISFTYRSVPMMLELAARKPHKLLKLMAIAGALNALGVLAGGGGDDERKLLPEEKAGSIWGMVPKLIRMPWNDANGSPVYLDIRRFIPVGDVFDIGQGHSAVPMAPYMVPGGPAALAFEMVLNKSMFTGKAITLETDTWDQKAEKVADYLYKAFAPNILGLPGTYATQGVVDATTGKTDAFGRQMSVAQAMATSFGVKAGSYPADVLRLNLVRKSQAEQMEIDRNITLLRRQRANNSIDDATFEKKVVAEIEKKQKIVRELAEKMN